MVPRGKIVMDQPQGGAEPRGQIQMDSEQPEGPGVGEALARGAAQGFTLNHADEIAGAVEALKDKLAGAHEALGELYQKHRDESRALHHAAEKAHPVASLAGNVAGGLGLFAVPGVGEIAGAGGGLGGLVAGGATLGALAGEGASEGKDVQGIASDAAKGALEGAAGGALAHGAGKLVQAAGRALAPVAEKTGSVLGERALTGGGGRIAARKLLGDEPEKVARAAYEAGAFRGAPNPEGIAQRLGQVAQEKGAAIGQNLEQLAEQGVMGAPAAELRQKLLDRAAAYRKSSYGPEADFLEKLASHPELQDAGSSIAEALQKQGIPPEAIQKILDQQGIAPKRLGLVQGEQFKRSLQDASNYSKLDPGALERVRQEAAAMHRQATEDAIHQQAGPEAAERFIALKNEAAPVLQAKQAADEAAVRFHNKSIVSPFHVMTGAVLGHGNPLLTGAAILGQHELKARGPALGAQLAFKTADKLKDVVSRNPGQLGKYGLALQLALKRSPAHFATANLLLSQTDPTYQAMIAKMNEENP